MNNLSKNAKNMTSNVICSLYKKHKNPINTTLKSVLFLLILGTLVLGTRYILGGKDSPSAIDIRKYPDSYDVCIIGRSTAMDNISCQELYERYGIAGICAAAPLQGFPLTLYTLEEIFEYQSPQVVILDTRAFFDTAQIEIQRFQDEDYLHISLDNIKTHSIKNKALDYIGQYNKNLDKWNYYSKLYHSHTNWKTISEKNFLPYDTESANDMHGNSAYFDIASNPLDVYANSKPNIVTNLPKRSEQYVSEAVEICAEHGADLMLVTSYTHLTKSSHNALVRLANKNHIKYIDINEYRLKSGLNCNLDLCDMVHLNLAGAIKVTDLLGDYLKDNYKFTDKRKDSSYQRYEDQRELFHAQKTFMYSKQNLLSATSFYRYLTALNKLDLNENVIFLSVDNNALYKLTAKESELLQKLGLKTNLQGKTGGSYAALISKNDILEDFSFINAASLTGDIGALSYEIISGGLQSSEPSSILINGQNDLQTGNGFNFVVYNTRFEQLVNACFFDTVTTVNPPQSRYQPTTSANIQHAMEPNVWENSK